MFGTLPDFLSFGHIACAGELAAPIAELEAEIIRLELSARYADALRPATQILDARRSDPRAQAWEIQDAERVVRLLELESSLPESTQALLAEADSLAARVIEIFEAGGNATPEARRTYQLRRDILGKSNLKVLEALNQLCVVSNGDAIPGVDIFDRYVDCARGVLGEELRDPRFE